MVLYLGPRLQKKVRETLIGRYCSNWLSPNHSLHTDTSEAGCQRCSENQHTLLHFHEKRSTKGPSKRRRTVQNEQQDYSSDEVLTVDASDSGTETRPLHPPDQGKDELNKSGAQRRPFHPEPREGAETRPFRPLLQNERRTINDRRQRRHVNHRRLETRSL